MTGYLKDDKDCVSYLVFPFLMTGSVKEGKEFKIERVCLRSLISITLAGSKEKRNL